MNKFEEAVQGSQDAIIEMAGTKRGTPLSEEEQGLVREIKSLMMLEVIERGLSDASTPENIAFQISDMLKVGKSHREVREKPSRGI